MRESFELAIDRQGIVKVAMNNERPSANHGRTEHPSYARK